MTRSRMSPQEVLASGPVMPVIVLQDAGHAVPLAKALLAGGIRTLEITLRSEAALEAIRRVGAEVPEAMVGAGTVLTREDLQKVADAGGRFAVSPGSTPDLLAAAKDGPIPLIPGIATPSELMQAMEQGFAALKFFPAEAAGGVGMLKSLAGPFPQAVFCPTGGISARNCREYLALSNVVCVGGSWIAPPEMIERGEWSKIAQLAKQAVSESC